MRELGNLLYIILLLSRVHNRMEKSVECVVCSALNVCGESHAWNVNHVRLLAWECSGAFVYSAWKWLSEN